MKKLITILLTLLMVFTLVGCNSDSKEEQPIADAIQEEVVNEPIVEEEPEQLAGGWTEVSDSTITDELKDIFTKALEGILGATYKPTKLLATQVVNGINYKFLAEGEKTTNPPVKGTYNITINKSSDGSITLLDIEVVEEELPEQKQTKDITQMSFWVVFYDQYGNELQREALKYGSTPSYKKDLPEGFEKWVYKKTQKDVGILKAITGNTYYQAICHTVSHKSSGSSPESRDVNYLYFKNRGTAETFITMVSALPPLDVTLEFEYSKDKTNWNSVTICDNPSDIQLEEKISINENEKIYFKAKTSNPYMIKREAEIGDRGVVFISGNNSALEVGGSIMTLLDPTDTLRDLTGKNTCFAGLFSSMGEELKYADNLVAPATKLAPYCYDTMFYRTGLVSVNPDLLPATNLSVSEGPDGSGCYSGMFSECPSLINAPKLPATTLSNACYVSMFSGCLQLITAPALPARILCDRCYDSMFKGCSSLTTAPTLSATSLAKNCYESMFANCVNLETAPAVLPATILFDSCYQSMFEDCSKLTTAPTLSATSVADKCCYSMFANCVKLETAPALLATSLADNCYDSMFANCANLETAPEELPATVLAKECYQFMFEDCSKLTKAPALRATTGALKPDCYYGMFYDCESLNCIEVSFNSFPFSDDKVTSTGHWLDGVSSNGIFKWAGATTGYPIGSGYIPSGWTVTN